VRAYRTLVAEKAALEAAWADDLYLQRARAAQRTHAADLVRLTEAATSAAASEQALRNGLVACLADHVRATACDLALARPPRR
jgi:2-hydroxychromene-2-carboxylate isomerase